MSHIKVKIPRSRIATFDVFAMGKRKNHVAALIEFDVTQARIQLKNLRKRGQTISFTAWVTYVISHTLKQHPYIASCKTSKRNQILFDSINVAMIAEKNTGNEKVPLPFIIENAGSKSAETITKEMKNASQIACSQENIVINRKQNVFEALYYYLPRICRQLVWKIILKSPKVMFKKMGNVSITSLSAAGKMNSWVIHSSIHPVSFGIGPVMKKPVVVGDEIQIREMLNMTILFDHDLVDGMPMAAFVKDLNRSVEACDGLD
jgi:pyruvate/2-oxoglutarate dehydrogenase complex dihydrolipoamide acyltransferase (E2) component